MLSPNSRHEGRGGLQKVRLAACKAIAAAEEKPSSCSAFSNGLENCRFWTQQDYESSGFCATYTHNLFSDRAYNIYSFLKGVDSFYEGFLSQWASCQQQQSGVEQPVLRITSFGCGPSTDAVALVCYLREIAHTPINFHVTLIDRASNWREIALSAVGSVLDAGDTVEFIQATWTSSTSAAAAVDADILCFSHVLADAEPDNKVPEAASYITSALSGWSEQPASVPSASKLLIITDRSLPNRVFKVVVMPPGVQQYAVKLTPDKPGDERTGKDKKEFLNVFQVPMSPPPSFPRQGSVPAPSTPDRGNSGSAPSLLSFSTPGRALGSSSSITSTGLVTVSTPDRSTSRGSSSSRTGLVATGTHDTLGKSTSSSSSTGLISTGTSDRSNSGAGLVAVSIMSQASVDALTTGMLAMPTGTAALPAAAGGAAISHSCSCCIQ